MKQWLGYCSCVEDSEAWGSLGQQVIVGTRADNQNDAEKNIRNMIPGNWELHMLVEYMPSFGTWHIYK